MIYILLLTSLIFAQVEQTTFYCSRSDLYYYGMDETICNAPCIKGYKTKYCIPLDSVPSEVPVNLEVEKVI